LLVCTSDTMKNNVACMY